MGSPKTPKVPTYNPADIANVDAAFNRVNQQTPFGTNSWRLQDGQWWQDQHLSPEMQAIWGRVQGLADNKMPHFNSRGAEGTPWGGRLEQTGGHLQNRKQQAQSMDYAPPQGQGLSQAYGGPLAAQGPGQRHFQPSSSLSSPNNQQSARDAAALYGDLVPHPGQFDPMKFSGVYDQMFGSRIYGGPNRR